MAAIAHFTKKLSKISPLTKLATKYSPGTKDLMKTIEPVKKDKWINEPVTEAGKARARSASSYLSNSSNTLG